MDTFQEFMVLKELLLIHLLRVESVKKGYDYWRSGVLPSSPPVNSNTACQCAGIHEILEMRS